MPIWRQVSLLRNRIIPLHVTEYNMVRFNLTCTRLVNYPFIFVIPERFAATGTLGYFIRLSLRQYQEFLAGAFINVSWLQRI